MVLHGQTQSYHIVLTWDTFQNTVLGHDSITFQTENYPCVAFSLNQTDVHRCESDLEYFTFHWVKVLPHVRMSPERFVSQWFKKAMNALSIYGFSRSSIFTSDYLENLVNTSIIQVLCHIIQPQSQNLWQIPQPHCQTVQQNPFLS